MSYRHFSIEERYYIEAEIKQGVSQSKIAETLGRNQGSISRELSRNKGQRGYRHKQAQNFASDRSKKRRGNLKLTEEIKQILRKYIEKDWSPEQIAGRLKKEKLISLHYETIYQYILRDKQSGGELYKHLRHQKKRYRKRYGSTRSRTGIPNRIDIDERPKIVAKRGRFGDWEADTIIGKNHKGAIVTLDERKSKIRLAFPLKNKRAKDVTQASVQLLAPLKSFVKTITFDNGKEFTAHEKIAKELECNTYFAKPFHSWERGQNENANGLLRQYFPKSMELNCLTENQVYEAVNKLNSRPKKCLDFKTPYEVFFELTGINIQKSLELCT